MRIRRTGFTKCPRCGYETFKDVKRCPWCGYTEK